MIIDNRQLISAVKQIAEEKGISEQSVFETLNSAIAAAYKKDFGRKSQIIKARLNVESDTIDVWQVKYVIQGIDEEGNVVGPILRKDAEERDLRPGEEGLKIKYNPEKHILLQEAQAIDPNLKVGDELIIKLKPETSFGRIAAQTAKQVIIQKLKEAEKLSIYDEFKKKQGEVVSGVVQRLEGRTVYMNIGRTIGILLPVEQISFDNYKIGRRFRVMILSVEETNKGPVILLSRSHPNFLAKLFEIEVPEISSGAVEIKSVSREAGSRSKIAVTSNQPMIDPIGSLIGQKGIRVQTVINELSGEKIDIVEWSDDPVKFISNAMAPAKVLEVKILDQRKKHALVEVAEDQFSLAIGKKGQNVRLAAKLTNWKIDVRSPKEELKSEEIKEENEL